MKPRDPNSDVFENLAQDVWWSPGMLGSVIRSGGRRDPNVRLPREPSRNPRQTPVISEVDPSTAAPGAPRACPPGGVPEGGKCVYYPEPPVANPPLKCPPGTVRGYRGDCVRVDFNVPSVDPQLPPCPSGQTRGNDGVCRNFWTPSPFRRALRGALNVLIGSAYAADLGKPAPKRSPGPSRRRRPRPAPRPQRRPARPPRTPRRTPRTIPRLPIPGLPADFPSSPTSPIDFVIREWQLYTRPLGKKVVNPRRGGARTRARFPTLPPVTLPAPGPLPVDMPTPAPRRSNAPAQSTSPSPAPVPPPARTPGARAPRAAPRARPSFSPLVSALLSPLVFGSTTPLVVGRIVPRSQPRQRQLADPIGDPLTPQQPAPGLGLRPGNITIADNEGNPCEVRVRKARRERYRRRKQCKKFVTKKIRVCAD